MPKDKDAVVIAVKAAEEAETQLEGTYAVGAERDCVVGIAEDEQGRGAWKDGKRDAGGADTLAAKVGRGTLA